MGDGRAHAVDVIDVLRSPCCRACVTLLCALVALVIVAPLAVAQFAWRLLPNFEKSEVLPGVLFLATGVVYQPGDDWAFECMKQRCPTESLFCLFDRDCRELVTALYVGVDGTGRGLCSRDLAREAACGTTCSRTATSFLSCLEGDAGRQCGFATDEQPVVVHRGAMDDAFLSLIDELAREQAHTPGNHIHRSFGSDAEGNSTTGHMVTWLTPSIHQHNDLVDRLRELARKSASDAQWNVQAFESLTMRCAEVLEYGDGNSTGLGWHWDVGSTLTMVTMLHPASDGSGELQLSTNCTVQRVPLRRGDVAVYRSRHRHRVTTVTSPRRVLAVEWWRGKRTELPHRPAAPSRLLQEPLAHLSDQGAAPHDPASDLEVEL